MSDRQLRKIMRARLLKQSPEFLYNEIVELRDALEFRLELAKGDKGDQGFLGPMGPKGDSIRGPQGEKGDEGKDGYTPIKNIDYRDGRDGKDGKDGKDISFDPTPLYQEIQKLKKELEDKDLSVKQVIETINGLKGDERIDARAIKNLPTSPIQPTFGKKKKIDFSDMRWHGGGGDLSIANFTTVVPSGLIDGVNTTYTVPTTIHSVINFNLNGEFIAPSEYSFSGTTITFFVPLLIDFAGLPFYITYV